MPSFRGGLTLMDYPTQKAKTFRRKQITGGLHKDFAHITETKCEPPSQAASTLCGLCKLIVRLPTCRTLWMRSTKNQTLVPDLLDLSRLTQSRRILIQKSKEIP